MYSPPPLFIFRMTSSRTIYLPPLQGASAVRPQSSAYVEAPYGIGALNCLANAWQWRVPTEPFPEGDAAPILSCRLSPMQNAPTLNFHTCAWCFGKAEETANHTRGSLEFVCLFVFFNHGQ
jgi:hypothetical protein